VTYDGGTGDGGRSSGVSAATWVIVTLVVALIGAIGVIIGGYVSRDSYTPTPTVTASSVPSPVVPSQAPRQATQDPPKPLPYKIHPPAEATVPMCTDFSGTGSAPAGRYLRIVVQSPPLDKNTFYFQDTRPDYPSPSQWRAKATVGEAKAEEAGQIYRIGIVTVTPELHAAINKGDYKDGVAELPDGSHDEGVWIEVTAGEDRTPC
jgi:hypothetical protein